MNDGAPIWLPQSGTLAEAAASLMAVIDAEGGNPAYPHGGSPFKAALWELCRQLLDKPA